LLPLVVDFFADADTLRMASACVKLEGDIRRGFTWKELAPALAKLAAAAPSPPLGFVYGAGFEDRTGLLAKVAERFRLIGNDAATVERVKDPESFFGALARLGIPHPRTATDRPAGGHWLCKRKGGAGGSHIVRLKAPRCEKNHIGPAGIVPDAGETAENRYFQEVVPGYPLSALFVATGREARVLGFSGQWTSPRRGAKWRYGGAMRPADLSRELEQRLTDHAEAVAGAFALKGLGSADFLVDGEEARLIEINPRPGATLDIFDSEANPLLHLHLQSVLEGILPMAPLPLGEATATAIVYAPAPLEVAPGMVWPDWTSDQPKPGERIDKNRPICTVLARASTGPDARRLVEERRDMILRACRNKDGGNQ
jgi:predicted ATP-grasp superfamily ATP-dependent carboligase